jgi:hypothetical protein
VVGLDGRILTCVAIRDRDRKILWARAGNRCSICRALLVQDGEIADGLTIIGDECHIVSATTTGPRAGAQVSDVDGYHNLILLCPNDHRLVDTLVDDYPPDRLHSVKRSHEEWVRETLATSKGLSPLTILRATPTALRYLGTAKELLGVAASAEESSLDYEPVETEDELDLVAGFLQLVHDYAEMWDDYEPASRIRATFELDRELKALREQGWLIFGARTRGKLRGGMSRGDADWNTAYLRLVRAGSRDIVRVDVSADPGEPARRVPDPQTDRGRARN